MAGGNPSLNFCRGRKQRGLARLILDFNGVHAGVIPHGDKAGVELALCIRLGIMKSLVAGHQRTARLFDNVEISQQGEAVASDIKTPLPTPQTSEPFWSGELG